ncbi:MAG: cache domain-containing protein [Candidatus Competibacteraceae bacterium]
MFGLSLALPAILLAGSVWAADYGTPAEAKAMLEKVVAGMKKDKAKTLEEINKGEAGFKDRDLYPFCGGPDGKFTAHPKLVGQSLKDLKDKAGKPVGEEIYKAAQEGKISEVTYMWTRPGEDKAVEKVAYVTKIGDEVCAVGYYK